MTILTEAAVPGVSSPFASDDALRRSQHLRAMLLLCVALGAVLPALLLPAGVDRASDPGLLNLMRGMALIKTVMVLLAVGVLWWRFGRPVSDRVAAVYLLGPGLAAAGCVMIWKLSFIALAAAGFHLGEIAVLLVAWRDGAGIASRLGTRT